MPNPARAEAIDKSLHDLLLIDDPLWNEVTPIRVDLPLARISWSLRTRSWSKSFGFPQDYYEKYNTRRFHRCHPCWIWHVVHHFGCRGGV
jgi:hypothetical protein